MSSRTAHTEKVVLNLDADEARYFKHKTGKTGAAEALAQFLTDFMAFRKSPQALAIRKKALSQWEPSAKQALLIRAEADLIDAERKKGKIRARSKPKP